jgi:MFS family permease
MFPFASMVFTSKITERIANGLFSTPRDVYVLESSSNKGMSLAIVNCSKTIGCIIAPISVGILCHFYGGVEYNMSKILWICISLTFFALILSFFIKNKNILEDSDKPISIIKLLKNKHLSKIYFLVIVYFLGRFNDGFLALYLKKLNYPIWLYMGTIGFFNTAMFIISPILGALLDRKKIKISGFITIVSFILFNIVFYLLPEFQTKYYIWAFLGLIFWGIQRAGAQVVFCNMVYTNAPKDCRGTAVGLFSCLSGLGTFLSAFICGHLANIDLSYAFIVSGIFSMLSLIIFQKMTYENRV